MMKRLPIPFNNPGTYPGHRGVDYAQRGGTPVRAKGEGTVINRGYGQRSGYFIEIDYVDAATIFSCHFPSLLYVPPIGTRVGYNQLVALVGTTGNSSGNHLHEEVSSSPTTEGYWMFHDPNRVMQGGTVTGNVTARPLFDIQKALQKLKHYTGKIDGEWGPLTENAVKAFQKSRGLLVDGIYGVATDKALFTDTVPAPVGPTPAKYDGRQMKGVHGYNPFGIPYSGGLQKIARNHGYSGPLDQSWGAADGDAFVQFLRVSWGYEGNNILGPVMWKAIQLWLKSRWGYAGAIDGIPGPQTRKALYLADERNYIELD